MKLAEQESTHQTHTSFHCAPLSSLFHPQPQPHPKPKPEQADKAKLEKRVRLARGFSSSFAHYFPHDEVKAYSDFYDQTVKFMSGDMSEPFDIMREPGNLRTRYGNHPFGQGALLARRLVERGVRYVEVTSSRSWDSMHGGSRNLANLANELDGTVVDTVSDVCAANFETVARYYELKANVLGIDDLAHYDRYAPVLGQESEIPFDRARQIVLDAFEGFTPRLRELAERFFSEGWIDAALADGKRGGAYCAAVTPDHHPYVFMNYTGKPRDVMTLTHELGHGVHDLLAIANW